MTRKIGFVALILFVGTVWAANYAIGHLGDPPAFPGGPHTVPVWPGIAAPSGVLFIGLAFTLRDVAHRALGRNWVFVGIAAGALLSYTVSPSFAVASACAFALSETADLAVYTPLKKRGWIRAVVASNIVGLVVDSVLFLWLAFHSLQYINGQIIGKLWMTAAALPAVWLVRRAPGTGAS